MSQLDKSKPYGIAFVGDKSYYGQSGKYFNMSTFEEEVLPVAPSAPSGLICKICGAERKTPELFHEHLLAMHPDESKVLNPEKTGDDTAPPKDKPQKGKSK